MSDIIATYPFFTSMAASFVPMMSSANPVHIEHPPHQRGFGYVHMSAPFQPDAGIQSPQHAQPSKGTDLEASQIRIFNDTPVKFSGYHPDIIGFYLLTDTSVVTSYFVYNHTLVRKG